MVLERLSWRATRPNHAIFRLLTVASRGFCRPKRKLILLRTQSLVLCSKKETRRSFLRHLVSKAWILHFPFRFSKQDPCFRAAEEDGGDRRLVEFELACEADGVARQILSNLAIAVIAEAILMRNSAQQVLSLIHI